ncbi:MAG: hypothetical protein ACQGVC_17125, partial [Myxococcota bacterium]
QVQLVEPIYFEILPGTYTAPSSAPTGHSLAILEIGSFTTVRGAGKGVTVLQGDQDNYDLAVIGTIGAADIGNRDVNIIGLSVEGGWLTGSPSTADKAMGTAFRGVRKFLMRDVSASDTGHSCFYSSNIQDFKWENLDGNRCGNFADLGSLDNTQAGIYIFSGKAFYAGLGTIEGSSLSKTGSAGYNFRANSTGTNAWPVVDVNIFDSVAYDTAGLCLSPRSTVGLNVQGLRCIRTQGVQTSGDATDYDHANATQGMTLDGLLIRDSWNAGLYLQEYTTDTTVTNTIVDGTVGDGGSQPCLRIDQPHRGLTLKGLTLKDCGAEGILTTDTNTGPGDAPVIDGFSIENVGMEDLTSGTENAIKFNGKITAWTVKNGTIKGPKGTPIRFVGGVDDSLFENIVMDGHFPLFMGFASEATLGALTCSDDGPLDGRWWYSTDASGDTDCTFASGTGTRNAACLCLDGSWGAAGSTYATLHTDAEGITFSAASDNNVFRNVTILSPTDDEGIVEGAAVTNTIYQNIAVREQIGAFGTTNGVQGEKGILTHSGSSGNTIAGFLCSNLESTCVDFGAGDLDDFTAESVIVSTDTTLDGVSACTTGQLAIATDGDGTAGNEVLRVCEGGSLAGK